MGAGAEVASSTWARACRMRGAHMPGLSSLMPGTCTRRCCLSPMRHSGRVLEHSAVEACANKSF